MYILLQLSVVVVICNRVFLKVTFQTMDCYCLQHDYALLDQVQLVLYILADLIAKYYLSTMIPCLGIEPFEFVSITL